MDYCIIGDIHNLNDCAFDPELTTKFCYDRELCVLIVYLKKTFFPYINIRTTPYRPRIVKILNSHIHIKFSKLEIF